MKSKVVTLAVLGLAIGACGRTPVPPPAAPPKLAAAVDAARLVAADSEPGNWMEPGRTYGEQHFSPLKNIDAGNVKRLGLAWAYDLDTAHRGQESTPLVIDGVMYVTSAWSKVFALDAKTGAPLWTYDPKVPGRCRRQCLLRHRQPRTSRRGRDACTWARWTVAWSQWMRQPASRSWEVATVPADGRYTITGAPRVVKGMVLIGNGGAEMGMRGYVTAYDADSGKQLWRFYTVPGDPSKPFESAALEKAAKTWTANGGNWAPVVRCGIPWRMTPCSI
jgi:quinohemoprotein ethanol dehydrogenase